MAEKVDIGRLVRVAPDFAAVGPEDAGEGQQQARFAAYRSEGG
jgi:hypothetical protein